MGATATVSTSSGPLSVEPGSAATCEVVVRNDGSVVDSFTVEPLGVAAAWTTVEPPVLPLFPGNEGTVTLRFAPPRSADVKPGPTPFAVRVVSSEDPHGSIVEEGVVAVGTFTDVGAELSPRTSRARGRRRGRHQLAVDNRGNVPVTLKLRGEDPDEKLDIEFQPPELEVAPGVASIVKVRSRGRERFWRGQPQTHRFKAAVEREGEQQALVDGQLLQEAVVPDWVMKAILLALVALAALAALWFAVLRPTIRDAAKDIAGTEAKSAAEQAAKQAVAPLQQQVDQLSKQAGGGGGDKPTPTPTPTPSTDGAVDPLGTPNTVRLAASKSDQSPSLVLSQTRIVSVTDLILQNPEGDTGELAVLRGTDVVYAARLENFRDLDFHLIAPLEFNPGTKITMRITCENEPPDGGGVARPCTPALTVNGFARKPS